jgi:hypothetical protein
MEVECQRKARRHNTFSGTKEIVMLFGRYSFRKRAGSHLGSRKSLVVACVATLLSLESGSVFATQASSTKTAEWTVMVFMNAKNNLECFGLQNFKWIELREAPLGLVPSTANKTITSSRQRPTSVTKRISSLVSALCSSRWRATSMASKGAD